MSIGIEIKNFLESCPVGKTTELGVDAVPRKKYEANIGEGAGFNRSTQSSGWVIPIPRLKLFCSVCNGMRNFNPSSSYPLVQTCIDLGQGPRKIGPRAGKEFIAGQHVDQFLLFTCGESQEEEEEGF